MFVSLLLLGSVGILMAALTDSSADEDVGSEGGGVSEPQDVEDVEDNTQITSSSSSDSYVEFEGAEGQVSDLPVPENSECDSSTSHPVDVFTLDITSADNDDSTEPLADFNSNPNTPIIRLDEFDYINIDLNPEDGNIGVLRADYFERSDSSDGSELESLHSGVNFYFIPNGETFPDDYVWSRDGANLYNDQSYINNSADFGEIRLVLRVDTGFLYNASSYAAGVDFSDEMFEQLEELIIGSETLHHISGQELLID